MNRRIAALHLARRHPDWDVLESHMGKRKDTLRKELTGVNGYKWGVEDEELLVALCIGAGVSDPLAPITAAAANAGALLVPLPQSLGPDGPTFKCLADVSQGFGEFIATSAAAACDDHITANELRDIEERFGRLVAMGQGCLSRFKAIHDADKPAHLDPNHQQAQAPQ